MLTRTRITRALTSTPVLMTACVLTVGGLLIAYGERIKVAGGFGFDGALYGKWTKAFWEEIFVKQVSEFRVQRILPSGAVHYALRAIRASFTNLHVVRAFQIYDLALLAASAPLWCAIGGRLGLSTAGKWLGFAALYANFANLKHAMYYPVLGDSTAFALGMLMLWAWLAERPLLLMVTVVVGAFAWPSLAMVGLILFALPRRDTPVEPVGLRLAWIPGAAAVALVYYGVEYYYFDRRGGQLADMVRLVDPGLVWLAIAAVLGWVFAGAALLGDARALWRPQDYARALGWRRLALRFGLAAAVYVLLRVAIKQLSNGQPGLGFEHYMGHVLLEGLQRPFKFLVARVVYYGPIIVLAVLSWRDVARRIQAQGPGLVLVSAMVLLQMIGSESRQAINALPILVAFTVQAVEGAFHRRADRWLFVGICLLYSKIWFLIEKVPLTGDHMDFPFQRYFMNHGPWMSDTMLVAQGGVVLLTFAYYGLWLRQRTRTDG